MATPAEEGADTQQEAKIIGPARVVDVVDRGESGFKQVDDENGYGEKTMDQTDQKPCWMRIPLL